MQNTTKNAENPNRLMENFFIVGISQDTFVRQRDEIGSIQNKEVTPEILFSMYGDTDALQKYVQFIIPQKFKVTYGGYPQTFHTFTCVDEGGN